jgi:hypothetical protein
VSNKKKADNIQIPTGDMDVSTFIIVLNY